MLRRRGRASQRGSGVATGPNLATCQACQVGALLMLPLLDESVARLLADLAAEVRFRRRGIASCRVVRSPS